MIVVIDEETFSLGVTPGIASAVEDALAAARLGLHRLLVSPLAIEMAEVANPVPAFLPNLKVIQAGWVEGQAIADTASRVLVLTGNEALRGQNLGNRFYIHADDVDIQGVFREPSVVMESMATDIKLLKTYLQIVLDLSPVEVRRFWSAKPELGGGSTTFNFVHRYVGEANPMSILVDRDSDAMPARNSTAGKVVEALVSTGMFQSRDEAHIGGFSSMVPNLSFHILGCRSIENLILPNVMEIFFKNLCRGVGDTSRRASLVNKFRNFPDMSSDESKEWLKLKFKNSDIHEGSNIFDSGCIDRLLAWSMTSEKNFDELASALRTDMEIPEFDNVIRGALRDFWSVGQRLKLLA